MENGYAIVGSKVKHRSVDSSATIVIDIESQHTSGWIDRLASPLVVTLCVTFPHVEIDIRLLFPAEPHLRLSVRSIRATCIHEREVFFENFHLITILAEVTQFNIVIFKYCLGWSLKGKAFLCSGSTLHLIG